uniref:F-box domain-containing protein n=1 Tax=Leersia perrieri TaxID=77586 RepID=A0A0D9VMX9_9ORYZ
MSKNKKGRRGNRQARGLLEKDRFTSLPNDILINILERLLTPHAVRICSLSKKTAKLPALLSGIVLDVDHFSCIDPGYYLSLRDVIRTNGHVVDALDTLLTFRPPLAAGGKPREPIRKGISLCSNQSPSPSMGIVHPEGVFPVTIWD